MAGKPKSTENLASQITRITNTVLSPVGLAVAWVIETSDRSPSLPAAPSMPPEHPMGVEEEEQPVVSPPQR